MLKKKIEKVRRVHVSFYTDARIQTYFMRHPAAYILPIGLKHPGESIWKQARAGFQLCQWIDHIENCFVQKDVSTNLVMGRNSYSIYT